MSSSDIVKRWAGRFVATVLAAREPGSTGEEDGWMAVARAAVRVQTEAQWHRLVGMRLIEVLPCEGIVYGWGDLVRGQFRIAALHCAGVAERLGLQPPDWESLLTPAMRAWQRQRGIQHTDTWQLAGAWPHPPVSSSLADLRTLTVTAARVPHGGDAGFFALVNLEIDAPEVLEELQILAPLLWDAEARVRELGRPRIAAQPLLLTPREREILCWIARGKSDSQIAALANRSLHTVRNQVRKILAKFGTTNRVSAILLAHERGLLSLDMVLREEGPGRPAESNAREVVGG